MLVDIDVLVSEEIIMNLFRKIVVVDSCKNTEISLTIMTKLTNQINHIILTKQYTVVLLQSNLIVTVFQSDLSHNCDSLFELNCRHADISVYVYIIDYVMTEVHVYNDENVSLIILHKFRMNQVVKYEAEDCY